MQKISDYTVTPMVNRNFSDLNPLFIGSETCNAGQSYGPAVRKYTLIHYIVKGKGRIYKQDGVYHAGVGEAFIIHPNETVTYIADGSDPWKYQWVAFNGELAKDFLNLPTVFHFPSGLINEMNECMQKGLGEYRVAGLLFHMYAELFEKKSEGNHYVRQVKDYIHALYMTPLRVEDIAAQIGLDRRYLSRIFKQRIGVTIQEYIVSIRLEEAKLLLEEGRTVDESARICGYADTANFSKMFKKTYGISPKQWQLAARTHELTIKESDT